MGVTTWARTMHRLFALFALAAIAVAHSAPEDSAVAENFVQSAPEFVESQDDDYNMSAENLLAELNTGKSWKSLEADFTQLFRNEDSDTQMATLFSFQKIAKMDPEELGQLTMDAMHKDQSAELQQMYAAPKAKSDFDEQMYAVPQSDMVATDAKMEARAGWHRWRPHAHIPHRWRPVRQITRAVRHVARHVGRAVRHVGRWAAKAAKAVGGVIISAVKALGSFLKGLAAKLCRKVLRRVVKKVHKYVKKHVTRFCFKLCVKAAGKVYLLGGGSPAAGVVAAAIGAGCKIGCKLAFKALVKFIRHRYMDGAKMDVFVADFVCDSVGLTTGSRRRSSHGRSSRRARPALRDISRACHRELSKCKGSWWMAKYCAKSCAAHRARPALRDISRACHRELHKCRGSWWMAKYCAKSCAPYRRL